MISVMMPMVSGKDQWEEGHLKFFRWPFLFHHTSSKLDRLAIPSLSPIYLISPLGACPKYRLYSRLNWLGDS